ncbi:ROK family protein [Planosporangium flavigriseum]|uniref:Sugar kinase n=1 Tax=Planosporangium flavigriseum TaxID=373681 RepID=A0A8J3PLX3_9ACTN|nr:ROK family protein [Planosporangium flavigriseum]NJC63803.1 ROK family protein [Planosporangium flavigriseum]GIG73699.1 sugar kinase [Planosporangium flavigriseum]
MADNVVVALDVGGTGIKCALVDATGRVHHSERHATGRERGPDAVVATVLEIAEGLARTAVSAGLRPEAVGVVVPGVLDETAGMAVWSANLGFREVPLRELISRRLGLPVALGHDVRAGGLAEARLGAGRGFRHVLFVPIGTGIAAAHVVDGRVLAGAHGAAGELGHVVVRADGPPCDCGLRGCLEALASAAAVARRYAERAGSAGSAGSADRTLGADQVAALAAAGDPIAGAVWRDTINALADGLLTGLALFDPEAVVVGGGLAEAGEALLTPLGAALRARLTFHREPVLVRAALGDEAGCLGAGLIAQDALDQETP